MNMTGNFKKEDLRIQKTHKALMDAISMLLEMRNFAQITVNDLCEEAQISRATFYSHFLDKYDLLKHWLTQTKSTLTNNNTYDGIENNVNAYVSSHSKQIKNLVENANSETTELLSDFMLSLLNINMDKTDDGQMDPGYIVLSKFISGGMFNYLSWQVKNRFPASSPMMNTYFYDILTHVRKWHEEQK